MVFFSMKTVYFKNRHLIFWDSCEFWIYFNCPFHFCKWQLLAAKDSLVHQENLVIIIFVYQTLNTWWLQAGFWQFCDGILLVFFFFFSPIVTETSNAFFSAIQRNFLVLPASCTKRTQPVCFVAYFFWRLTGGCSDVLGLSLWNSVLIKVNWRFLVCGRTINRTALSRGMW